jgi:hypothetical protein
LSHAGQKWDKHFQPHPLALIGLSSFQTTCPIVPPKFKDLLITHFAAFSRLHPHILAVFEEAHTTYDESNIKIVAYFARCCIISCPGNLLFLSESFTITLLPDET